MVRKVVPGAERSDDEDDIILEKELRWWKKYDAVKPPRAHNCTKCGRYAFSPFP
jgi:palmitoyltransferase